MNKENKQPAELQAEETVTEETVEETVEAAVEETAEQADQTDEITAEEDAAEEGIEDSQKKKAKKEKTRSADMVRRLRHGRTAKLVTVGVVVLTLMLNVVFSILGDRFPLTLDLSTDKVFTLSEESTSVAQSLTRPVEIVVFAAEDTFSNVQSDNSIAFSGGMTQVATVLSEFYNATKQYNTLTDGKVTTTYIDMNRNPTAVTKYSNYKADEAIAEYDILFISDKQSKVINMNEGLFTYDASEYYSSGTLNISSTVEQTLATNLKAVQSTEAQVITFATGHEEDTNTKQGLQNIYTLNGYDVEEVDLTRSADINPNTVCLVIPAPTKDYSTETIERLRTWLHNDGKEGRNLMVFTDAYADCSNLYEFLNVEYGLEVTDKLVYENDLNKIYAYNPYYAFATIADSDYTGSCAGSEALAGFTRQIIPHWEEKTDTSTQYSVNLLTFSDQAQIIAVKDSESAAAPTGEAYDGTIVGMAVAVKEDYQNALQVSTTTKVAVCGSSYASHSLFTSMSTSSNEALFLDSMAQITGVSNSVNISSKSLAEETISFSPTTQIFVGLGLFTILLPLALLITGLVVFLKRRHL